MEAGPEGAKRSHYRVPRRVKWWIAGGVVSLFLLWQALLLLWAPRLSHSPAHRVDTLVAAAIGGVALAAFLGLLVVREERLESGAAIIWDLDQRMRGRIAAEAARQAELARELEDLHASLLSHCDHLAGLLPAGAPAEPLAALRRDAEGAAALARELWRVVDEEAAIGEGRAAPVAADGAR